MARSYRAQVASAFEVLAEGLAPVVDEHMASAFPDDDWILVASTKLGKRRDVLVSLSDPHFQLEVLNRWWGPVFEDVLGSEARNAVLALRTARNRWAHPDEDHPFDLEYALEVHKIAEDLLRSAGSDQADHMALLVEELRWDGVREQARTEGVSETKALMDQLAELQAQYDALAQELADARSVASTAQGKSRAFARQLAELQTQYAAVSGLREDYLALQRKLEESQDDDVGRKAPADSDASALRQQLASAELALVGLQRESLLLREQLDQARRSIRDVDPLETAAGRRWIWLISSLLVTLALVLLMATSLSTGPS